jgi:hypothetical protein
MNKTQKIILLTSAIFTIASWLYVLFNYSAMPNEIVGHMNFKGDVNRYDDKSTLWFVLTIFTAIQFLIFWISQKQIASNYGLKNIDVQKTITLYTLPYISFIMIIVILGIIKKTQDLLFDTSWFIYAVIFATVLFLITLFSFIYKNLTS